MANLSNINNKLLVGTNGEVRIGDTATVANVKLRVKQTAQQWTAQFVNTDSSVAYGISIDTSASSYGVAGTLQCYTNTGGGFIVRNDSKVGIGTTSPIAPLHVLTPAVGGIDLTNISRTANNLVRFTNPEYSTSATMGLLLRVFPDSDARQGAGLLMTGGSDNAASNLSLFVSKDDGTSSNISQSYSALHIAGNTGNVGIGTTSPDSKLDVKGASATPADGNQTLSITNTTGGTQLNIGTAENSYGWIEAREGATLRNLLLNPNGGNVGIGTTSPGNLLDVAGDTDISGQLFVQHSGSYTAKLKQLATSMSNATYTFEIDSTAHNSNLSTAGAMSVDVDSGRAFTINGLGNVGIGTNSPATKLNVANAGEVIVRSSMTAADGFRGGFEADNQHTGGTIWSMFSTNNSDGYFGGGKYVIANESMGGVDANTTAKFVIDGSGNVGIGTTSPSAKLEIVTAVGGDAIRLNFGQSADIFLGFNSANPRILLQDNANVVTHNFQSNGDNYIVGSNVGIGTTSPGAKLHIHQTGSGTSNTIITEDDARKIFIGRDSIKATDLNNNAQILHLQQNGGDAVFGGGIYLGGTATANKLDDYEEGTWTPAVSGSGTAGTVTYGTQGGSYTKIGNKVTCWFSITNFTQSGASGNFTITGLPFTCITTSAVRGCFSSNLRFYNMPFPGDLPVISLDDNNTSFIILWSRNNTTWIGQAVANTGNQYIEGYVTYSTA